MLYHIIGGFIIPWLLGLFLYKRQVKLIILISPIASTVAFFINAWGFNFYWKLDPSFTNMSLSAMPYELGYYPFLAILFIITIRDKKLKILTALLVFAISSTLFEFISVVMRRVIYRNEWNIYWTFLSYVLSYFIVFIYYQLLRKQKIL